MAEGSGYTYGHWEIRMLGLCYVVIQVIEILIGVWIVHSLYSEYRIYSKWARGILAVSCVILWIIYIGNA